MISQEQSKPQTLSWRSTRKSNRMTRREVEIFSCRRCMHARVCRRRCMDSDIYWARASAFNSGVHIAFTAYSWSTALPPHQKRRRSRKRNTYGAKTKRQELRRRHGPSVPPTDLILAGLRESTILRAECGDGPPPRPRPCLRRHEELNRRREWTRRTISCIFSMIRPVRITGSE